MGQGFGSHGNRFYREETWEFLKRGAKVDGAILGISSARIDHELNE